MNLGNVFILTNSKMLGTEKKRSNFLFPWRNLTSVSSSCDHSGVLTLFHHYNIPVIRNKPTSQLEKLCTLRCLLQSYESLYLFTEAIIDCQTKK